MEPRHLGTRGPVTLRIAEVINLVTAKNITADLQGRYPWTEEEPLLLTDVSVDVLGGNVLMKQLRMPQHDPALLRLNNLSSSELVSAVNPKQFAMSGAFSGALPLWLNNEKWIVKDGWLANSGPMTLRLDKDTADAVVKDNMTAGSAINWLRYMEISRSSTKINLDNLGLLTMQANITGTSRVDGKSGTVNLNYYHEENILRCGAVYALAIISVHGWSRTHVCREMTVRKEKSVRKNNENFTGCVDVIFYAGCLYAAY